jgi:hypothetical protein
MYRYNMGNKQVVVDLDKWKRFKKWCALNDTSMKEELDIFLDSPKFKEVKLK